MTPATRRLIPTSLVIALLLAACSSAGGSATPSVTPAATPTASGSAVPSIAPTPTATATPAASPSPTALLSSSPTPSDSASACVLRLTDFALPSDRFVAIAVSSTATDDRLTFSFGNPSLPGPPSPPKGSLTVAKPPFTEAASGAPIDLVGAHALMLRFTGMSLSNDVGQPTYEGPIDLKPDLTTLRHAVLFDASEGIIGWYVGYDGAGCVAFERAGNDLVMALARP